MKKVITKKSTKDIRMYRIIIIAFAIICILMGTFSYQYYKRLQNTVQAESKSYMMEISKHIASNVGKTLVDNFSVLGTIANVLKIADITSFSQLEPIILIQKQEWNYEDIILVDENGIAYDAQGNSVALGGGSYLREAVVKGTRSMSASQMINNKECIIFTIPIEGLSIDGITICALAATYDLSTFDQILSINTFDGQGYAHIIQRDGTVAVRSSSKYAEKSGYNILNTLAEAKFEGGTTIDKVKSAIWEGQSDQVVFSRNGTREYMNYTPLETQEWCLLTFVPVTVVNEKAELFMKTTLMLCGFITLAFAVLVTFLFYSFYRHKSKLEQIAYVDPITGGNTIQRFYNVAEVLLSTQGRVEYALIYTNIEKFKVLNEQFGRRVCNEMLCAMEKGVSEDLKEHEIIGRLAADNFCILVEYQDEGKLLNRVETWYQLAKDVINKKDTVWLAPIVEYGVYVVANDNIPFTQMVDRAKLALRESVRELKGRVRFAIYDDAVRKRIFREKYLEDRMESALENNEFQVYLQPKYRTKDEKIGGAEALVRWVNEEGMIFPDEFITLFEQNGFILQLDLWVFERVCQTIRKWIDQGLTPVKISVNCSRVHLKNNDFLQCYCNICNKWNVLPKYLEIELTENVVFEDVEHLSKTIDAIHAAGFGCSMDDFGSGYSSLNLIQDIPVDTIKLDKVFFRSGTKDLKRMESVVGSILAMSKALDMEIVAEGVEEREQVDMLKRLQCDYIQGYYFSKPIPIAEFEKLAF